MPREKSPGLKILWLWTIGTAGILVTSVVRMRLRDMEQLMHNENQLQQQGAISDSVIADKSTETQEEIVGQVMDTELYRAVISGDQRLFENFNTADSYKLFQLTHGHKNSILHIAAKYGEMQIAEKIVSLCSSLLHQTNSKGDSPLHIAARLGHFQMAQLLINCAKLVEVEVEKELLRMQNLNKDTALHEAVLNRHFEVVNLLINEDPELAQFVNNSGESPLFIAVDRKFYKIACLIFEAVPMCAYGGRSSMNVLHVAIIRADKRLLFVVTNMLINRIALYLKIIVLHVNQFLPAAFKIGCLQIKLSCKFSSIGADFMSKVLKRCPSTIHEADRFGWIPLHYAAHLGNVEVVDLLLQYDISLAYVKDKEGMSALHISAKAGQDDVILQLIARYPDISELIDDRGRTALHVAAESGKSSVIKIFLSTAVLSDTLNCKDNDGNTPFHSAATQGRCEVLLLLANDSRVDKWAINKLGLTTLDIIKSSTHFKQHEKAQILWKMKARGALTSLEHLSSIETIELQAIETKGLCQPQQLRDNEPGEAIDGEAETNNASHHIKEMDDVNLLIATIVATVTFAAALAMSGGSYSDDKDNQGMAILSKRSGFRVFMVASSIAFGLSTASIFIHFGASRVKRDHISSCLLRYTFLFTEWSIYAMVLAFIAGTSTILTESMGLTTSTVTTVCFLLGPLIYALVTSNLYT